MAPVAIRYYRLYNLSVSDTAIYPQLRETHEPRNNVVWDGQKVGGQRYRTSAGQETIIDLDAIGLSINVSFFLGQTVENSQQSAGWTLEQGFSPTQDSDLMATAIWRGDRNAGTFEYVGIKSYKGRRAEEADDQTGSGYSGPDHVEAPDNWMYVGIILLIAGVGAVVTTAIANAGAANMAAAGYSTTYDISIANTIKVKVKTKRSELNLEDVPPGVQADWDKAYEDTKDRYPKEVKGNGDIRNIKPGELSEKLSS